MTKVRRKRHQQHHTSRNVLMVILIIVGLAIVGGAAYAARMYHDVSQTANVMYKGKGKVTDKRNGSKVDLNKKQPFSILLLGTDTGALGRNYTGRTDSMVLATVNPANKKTEMLSIARDSRVNIAGEGKMAKINAAYEDGGITTTINTVQNFLNVPVDYYVLMNMKGIEQLVDAVGGVKVNNPFAFDYGGSHFAKGEISLNGTEALKFSRMRYDDPNNDFGRQLRQQSVIKAVLDKAASVDTIAHYNDFLNAAKDNMKTNLTLNDILAIRKNYKGAMKFDTKQLKGEGQMIDGQSYQVMEPTQVKATSNELRDQLNLK